MHNLQNKPLTGGVKNPPFFQYAAGELHVNDTSIEVWCTMFQCNAFLYQDLVGLYFG
jgi:hypothetical protein